MIKNLINWIPWDDRRSRGRAKMKKKWCWQNLQEICTMFHRDSSRRLWGVLCPAADMWLRLLLLLIMMKYKLDRAYIFISLSATVVEWLLWVYLPFEFTSVLYPSGMDLAYTNWNDGEPNDSGSNEDCAVLGNTGRWNDVACTRTFSYMCEVPQDHCDVGKWDIRCNYID